MDPCSLVVSSKVMDERKLVGRPHEDRRRVVLTCYDDHRWIRVSNSVGHDVHWNCVWVYSRSYIGYSSRKKPCNKCSLLKFLLGRSMAIDVKSNCTKGGCSRVQITSKLRIILFFFFFFLGIKRTYQYRTT